MSTDHYALLECDNHVEPMVSDTLAFEHPHYDISSSTPDKEYMQKIYLIVTCLYKDIKSSQQIIYIYNIRYRTMINLGLAFYAKRF